MADNEIQNGKWLCSTNEEHWGCYETFDTRADALAYGISELAVENGLDDGQRVYTGQVSRFAASELAEAAIDGERIIENIDEWLYDNLGGEHDHELVVTKEQRTDLETRLRWQMVSWLDEHKIKAPSYRIEHVKSEIWNQCDVHGQDVTDDGSKADPPTRCINHDGHEGGHDFP
jgi:hypothetical protein